MIGNNSSHHSSGREQIIQKKPHMKTTNKRDQKDNNKRIEAMTVRTGKEWKMSRSYSIPSLFLEETWNFIRPRRLSYAFYNSTP